MPAPAVIVTTETSPPPRSNPTDTGPLILAGLAERGPAATSTTPSLLDQDDAFTSLTAWARVHGNRITNSRSYDYIETYFRNGGNKLYFTRVLGDTPVKASINLAGTAGTTLVVTADQYGSVFNSTHKVSVTNGSDSSHRYVKLTAGSAHPTKATDTVIAQTVNMTTRDDAVGTAVLSDPDIPGATFSISAGGGSGLPTVAASTALSNGTDDYATADQTNVDLALDQCQPDLGPGQVVAVDWLSTGAHAAVQGVLQSHASENNRFAVLDSSSATASKATLLSEAGAVDAGATGSYSMYVGTWITVAPYSAGGADRTVPGSALVCARFADTDANFHPNRAAAGTKDGVGVARWATGVASSFARTPQGFSDADALSDAGVNLIVLKNGQVVVFDDVTLVAPTGAEANYLQVPNARYRMWTVARATAIGEGAQFDQINRGTIAQFGIDLEGILKADYVQGILVGDLDDDRPATAYNVDVTTPNTAETMQAGELNANIAVRPARSARIINITITAVGLTESVA